MYKKGFRFLIIVIAAAILMSTSNPVIKIHALGQELNDFGNALSNHSNWVALNNTQLGWTSSNELTFNIAAPNQGVKYSVAATTLDMKFRMRWNTLPTFASPANGGLGLMISLKGDGYINNLSGKDSLIMIFNSAQIAALNCYTITPWVPNETDTLSFANANIYNTDYHDFHIKLTLNALETVYDYEISVDSNLNYTGTIIAPPTKLNTIAFSTLWPGSTQNITIAPYIQKPAIKSYESTNNIIYYFDMNSSSYASQGVTGDWYSDLLAVDCIQGIVNRTAPRLLVLAKNFRNYIQDLEWKTYYESIGYKFVKLYTISDLVKTFKPFFKGIVSYGTVTLVDGRNPAATAAANVGALTDRIPVRSDYEANYNTNYGLFATYSLIITDEFEQNYDSPITINGHLENLGWVTSMDAHNWLYKNIMKFCAPSDLINMFVDRCDQAAQKKMFNFYLRQTDTSENTLLNSVYAYYDARNEAFRNWGWGSQEDTELDRLAQYGGYISLGSSNLSFHNMMPSSKSQFSHAINYTKENVTVENKYYISFMQSDEDTMSTPISMQYGAWNDPLRGQVPISWGLPSGMSKNFPAVFNHHYSTATNNDYFFSGGFSPLGFVDYDELAASEQTEHQVRGAEALQRTGQKIVDLYSSSGAIGTYDKTQLGNLGAKLGVEAFLANNSAYDYEYWNNVLVLNRPDLYQTRPVDLSDTFSNSTYWTRVNGTWAIESGEYSQSSTNGLVFTQNHTTVAHTNYKADVKYISSLTGKAGIVFRRGSTGTNYYSFYLKNGNKAVLSKVVNGVETLLGAELNFTAVAGTKYTLKVVASDTNIKCYINNIKYNDQTDSTFTSGSCGLYSTVHAHFDNAKLCKTSQTQQVINWIKSKTVDISKAKPFFLPGPTNNICNYTNNWNASEPGAGETATFTIKDLKTAMDTINSTYPGQFKFVRLDEMVAAARKQYNHTMTDRTMPVATAVEGLGTQAALQSLTSASLRVRITENTNIDTNAVTLKWAVPGKSGTGSVLLSGSGTAGVDLSFNASGINLVTPIAGGIAKTDKINFWVEGKDVAANTFSTWRNNSTDPLFTLKIDQRILSADQFGDWTWSSGVTLSTDITTYKNGTNSMKVIYPNASWTGAVLWKSSPGMNALDGDGVGMWIKSTVNTVLIKLIDSDGTECVENMSVTANAWTYVYKSFASGTIVNGDGYFNKTDINMLTMMYDTSFGGSGATAYYDDIEFVKNGNVAVDNDRYKDWIHSNTQSNDCLYPSVEAVSGTNYMLKAVYQGNGSQWQSVSKAGKWNAANADGIGFWTIGGIGNIYIKLTDEDGTTCQGTNTFPTSVQSYTYMTFASGTISGGNGVWNKECIVKVELMFYTPWGDGISWYGYYFDDISFVKNGSATLDCENFDNVFGKTNAEKTVQTAHSGNYSLKMAFHKNAENWQSVDLSTIINASTSNNLTLWVKAPISKLYVKVFDNDGTSCQGLLTPTANQWSKVSLNLNSLISGSDSHLNKSAITKIEISCNKEWISVADENAIYYLDDLYFDNVLDFKGYSINDNNSTFSGFEGMLTISEFLNNISSSPDINYSFKENNILIPMNLYAEKRIANGISIDIYTDTNCVRTLEALMLGDLDSSGYLEVVDLALVKRALLRQDNLQGIYFKAADLTNNNTITISDLIVLKKRLLDIT